MFNFKAYENRGILYNHLSTTQSSSSNVNTTSSSASTSATNSKEKKIQLSKTSKFTTLTNSNYQQSHKIHYQNEALNVTTGETPISSFTATASTSAAKHDAKKYTDSVKLSQKLKKKSELSESRERFTNIRYFYADPEIDKAVEKPLIRLNPMTMLYMGVSDDNSHLLQSANCKILIYYSFLLRTTGIPRIWRRL